MIRAFALRPLAFTSALAAAAMLAACGGEPAKPVSNFTPVPVTPVIGDVPIGSADAPLEIVEYAALTCHVCRDFAKQIFPRLKATYIDTGKVRYIYRDYPLEAGPDGKATDGLQGAGPHGRPLDGSEDLLNQQRQECAVKGANEGHRPHEHQNRPGRGQGGTVRGRGGGQFLLGRRLRWLEFFLDPE